MVYKYNGRRNTTSAWVMVDIGFLAKNIIISATPDNTEDIKYSFDAGTTTDGEIAPGEPLTLTSIELRFFWIKSNLGGMEYRLWAWA